MEDIQAAILNDSQYINLMKHKAKIYNKMSIYGVMIMGEQCRFQLHNNTSKLIEQVDEMIEQRRYQIINSFEDKNKLQFT